MPSKPEQEGEEEEEEEEEEEDQELSLCREAKRIHLKEEWRNRRRGRPPSYCSGEETPRCKRQHPGTRRTTPSEQREQIRLQWPVSE